MLAKGYDLKDSVTVATAYLQQGLSDEQSNGQTAISSLKHAGYPTDRRYFPVIELGSAPLQALSHAFPATENRLGIYPVVDSLEWIERLLKAGVKTLQIRLKNRPLTEVEQAIQQAISLGKQYPARFFINDYWQLALKYGAYGVHLGQEDLTTADLYALVQAAFVWGCPFMATLKPCVCYRSNRAISLVVISSQHKPKRCRHSLKALLIWLVM